MPVRIDKWLWAVRLFKTRSLAVEACKKGRIFIGGTTIKPSRELKEGEVVQIRKNGVLYSFKALQLTDKRMGAKLVPDFLRDVTTPDQLQLLEAQKLRGFIDRARGTGRPTKRERRDLDDFTTIDQEDALDFFDDWDEEE